MSQIPHMGPTPEWPDRPDHEDFDRLSVLIIALDHEAEGPGFTLEKAVARYIDPTSLAYLAFQRALRALGIENAVQLTARMDEAVRAAAIYHEGFLMGCQFQQAKTNANRRSGDPRKRGRR